MVDTVKSQDTLWTKLKEVKDDEASTTPNSASSSKEAGAAGVSSFQLLRRIWPIAIVSSLMHIFMMLEVHIYVPYLYTRVSCCSGPENSLDSAYDINDPDLLETMRQEAHAAGIEWKAAWRERIPACSVPVYPTSSKAWSLSPQCTNKAYVQQSAQGVMATMKPLQKLFGFLVLPVGGALADAVGRTPVLGLYASGLLVACLLSAADAYMNGAWGNTVVYMAGCLFGLSFQPKDSILAGAVADVMGDDEANKARTFVALRTMDIVTSIFVNFSVYLYLRRHNETHIYAWFAFAGLAGLMVTTVLCCVQETLPKNLMSPVSCEMFNPLFTQFKALRIVGKDAALIVQACVVFIFYVYFLGFITTRTSYLTLVGFRMEDAILPEVLGTVVVLLLSGILMPLLPKLGVWHMSTLGCMLFATGYAFVGPFTVLVSFAGPYIASVIFSTGVLIIFPAFATIVSQRVEKEHQSKCQAAIFAVGTLGAVIGIPFYNRVLFDATAHGLDKAKCPIVSLCLAVLCAMLTMVVTCLSRRTGAKELLPDTATNESAPLTLASDSRA